jgi:hypothetical protein
MEAVHSYGTLASFYQTERGHIPNVSIPLGAPRGSLRLWEEAKIIISNLTEWISFVSLHAVLRFLSNRIIRIIDECIKTKQKNFIWKSVGIIATT